MVHETLGEVVRVAVVERGAIGTARSGRRPLLVEAASHAGFNAVAEARDLRVLRDAEHVDDVGVGEEARREQALLDVIPVAVATEIVGAGGARRPVDAVLGLLSALDHLLEAGLYLDMEVAALDLASRELSDDTEAVRAWLDLGAV